MRYLTILRLKCADLLAMRSLMVILLLLPPLLGLVAGSANLANQSPDIRLAIVDLEQNEASRNLVQNLQDNGWPTVATDAAQAERLLLRQAVDGIVTIEAGYGESLQDLEHTRLLYTPAEGSLVTTFVREAIAAAVLPEYSRRSLLARIEERYAELGEEPPAGLAEQFQADMAAYAVNQARLDVLYIGEQASPPALTYVVSDYSMEVFFLSIYAILGSIALAGGDLRRRLAATRRGLLLDYVASIAALFGLGLVQILLYALAMRGLMQAPLNLYELGLLAVFLFLMLGSGQLLSLLHESLRLYLSLLILLIMAIGGGCFFQLSGKLIAGLGQYLPHGWVLSRLKGYPALPALAPILVSLLLLCLGYILQKRRVSRIV